MSLGNCTQPCVTLTGLLSKPNRIERQHRYTAKIMHYGKEILSIPRSLALSHLFFTIHNGTKRLRVSPETQRTPGFSRSPVITYLLKSGLFSISFNHKAPYLKIKSIIK